MHASGNIKADITKIQAKWGADLLHSQRKALLQGIRSEGKVKENM